MEFQTSPCKTNLWLATFTRAKSAKTVGQNFIARVAVRQTLTTLLALLRAYMNTVANFSAKGWSALSPLPLTKQFRKNNYENPYSRFYKRIYRERTVKTAYARS